MYLGRIYAFVVAVLLAAVVLPPPERLSAQTEGPLLVLASKSTGVSNLELSTLRRLFQGYITEQGGKRLIPLNQTIGTPARTTFDWLVLGLTEEQVGRFWVDQRIRQSTEAPRSIQSPELAIRVVASLPGAVTYVRMQPSAVPDRVQIISVDGKRPTEPGYPLAARD